jgi:lysophospholipase L1-like esterase
MRWARFHPWSLAAAAAALLALGLGPVRADAPTGGSAPAAPGDAPAPAKRVYAVAAVGDSLTDARSGGGKYLGYLSRRCPESRFDNHGKGGEMVNQMRRRFARDVLGEGAPAGEAPATTHVIIFGGVNDLYSDQTAGRTPAKIEADLLWMYQAAKAKGIRVVAVTVAPWGGFRRYYNARRGAATRELNRWILEQPGRGTAAHAIDAYALLSCGDPERLCPSLAAPLKDGIHFGPGGHDQLGKALFEKVFADCR